jgi:hypothetical protein
MECVVFSIHEALLIFAMRKDIKSWTPGFQNERFLNAKTFEITSVNLSATYF